MQTRPNSAHRHWLRATLLLGSMLAVGLGSGVSAIAHGDRGDHDDRRSGPVVKTAEGVGARL